MTNPTTNYSFVLPTSASLVTNLPADFDVALQGVDTRLKALQPGTTLGDLVYSSATANTSTRLGIGTNGQVLSISGGVPAWATTADQTPLTTKGDLFTFTTLDARLGVGANGTVLTADSTASTGLAWATAASAGMTLISTTSLTGATVTLNSFSGYTDLQLVVIGAYGSNQITFHGRFNSDSGSNYYLGQMAAGANQAAGNKAVFGDGLSSSSTNVNIRNYSVVTIQRYAGTQGKPYQVQSGYTYWSNTAINYVYVENSIYASATAITSIDLFMSTGTFSGGTAYLYGVK